MNGFLRHVERSEKNWMLNKLENTIDGTHSVSKNEAMMTSPYIHLYVLVISDPKSSSEMILILTRIERCDWMRGRH